MPNPDPASERIKILFVEDEPTIIELITILLQRHQYEVIHVGEGDLVLAKVKEVRPDLIILDIMIPKLDGFEVCRQIKSDEGLKKIPIIILSALVQKGEIEMGIRMGADLYMTKPFQNANLLGNIEKLLKEGGLMP